MEGTSGAADLGLLRGSTGDAALGGIAGKVGVSLRLMVTSGLPVVAAAIPRQEVSERIGLGRSSCAPASGQSAAGGAGSESSRPLARETSVGARGALSARRRCEALRKQCVNTGGATAALGVARSRTHPARGRGSGHSRPSSRRSLQRWKRKPRPRGGDLDPRGTQRGASRRTSRVPGASSGPGGSSGPRGRKEAGRCGRKLAAFAGASPRGRSAQAHARGCSAQRGSVDRVVVLADCLDCRSRRAALGPPPFGARGSSPPALPPGRLGG